MIHNNIAEIRKEVQYDLKIANGSKDTCLFIVIYYKFLLFQMMKQMNLQIFLILFVKIK